MSRDPVLLAPPVMEAIDAELERRDMDRNDLFGLMADRFGHRPDSFFRVLSRARDRGWIDLHRADEYLTVLGLSLYDLPGYTYEYEPPLGWMRGGGRRLYPEATIAAAKREMAKGATIADICRQHKVHPRTARRWRAEM